METEVNTEQNCNLGSVMKGIGISSTESMKKYMTFRFIFLKAVPLALMFCAGVLATVELTYWLGLAVMHVKGTTQDLSSAQVFLTFSNLSSALVKEAIDYGLGALIVGLGILVIGNLCILILDIFRDCARHFCKVANSQKNDFAE